MYVVIYAMGGTENAKWKKSLPHPTLRTAETTRVELVRMGYPAYIRDERDPGPLPEGADPLWDYRTLRWRNG